MSKGTILITGATGYLGFTILLEALRNDYSARIVVRSESKATTLKSAPALAALNKASAYSFYVVPDLGAPGALDEAAKGADYVIHTASPLPFQLVEPEKQYDDIVAPAIKCTLSALESAKKSGSVKRVVITSSVGAFITPEVLLGPDQPQLLTLSEKDINQEMQPPYSHILEAYCASKTAALRRSLTWVEENKPSFDLVNIAPSYVQGRNRLAQSTKELFATSNGLFLRMVAGLTTPGQPSEVAAVCHIDDVAELHVKALDKEKIPGGESFIFSQDVKWNDVVPIAAKLFPEAVKNGTLPNNGNVESKKVRFSAEKGEKAFGIKLRSVEELVQSSVSQYLELLEKEKKEASA